jgi:hypothetical protein
MFPPSTFFVFFFLGAVASVPGAIVPDEVAPTVPTDPVLTISGFFFLFFFASADAVDNLFCGATELSALLGDVDRDPGAEAL